VKRPRNSHTIKSSALAVLAVLPAVLVCATCVLSQDTDRSGEQDPNVLFDEPFEDTNWSSRGWYDGPRMNLTADEHASGSTQSCVWQWKSRGDISPEGGSARAHISPVSSLTLSFDIRHSDDWTWTGVEWHPHELHFLTTEDDSLVGPAYTRLTFYIEAVNGEPRVGIQDGRNIDEGRVGEDLVGITENRSVAGGNGDSDGHGPGNYYRNGDVHWNGKMWKAGKVYFSDEQGPYYKGDWHHIEVDLKLNSVRDGIGRRDGVLRYRYDSETIMDYDDVVFRTGRYPDMLINQFFMGPYFGPGVPHPQKIWIDNLKITSEGGK